MESVGNNATTFFKEEEKFFKSDTFESDTIFVTFKSVTLNFSENAQKVLVFMPIMISKKI